MGSIKFSLRMAFTLTMVATLVVMTAGVASAAGPKEKVVYTSVPGNVPGNVPSQPFQAQQTSEFGDSVTLAGGPRKASSVEVVMSSWGCQAGTWNGGDCVSGTNATFDHPITLNLYAVNSVTGQPAELLTSSTKTFAIPYRPSAAAKCTGADAGKWYSKADKTCYNGFVTKIDFTLDGTVLPNDVIWTVAFNTSGYGTTPLGYATPCATSIAGCGYDSLNVGTETFPGQPSKGTDADPDLAVRDGSLESGWTGYTPLATIRTK